MPASLIEDENSMSAGADPGGDLVQMQLQTYAATPRTSRLTY